MNLLRNGSAVLLAVLVAAPAMATPITAVISLKPRVSMRDLAHQVQDPSSPRYGHYFSPQEIRDLSAPSARDYKNMLVLLRQEGFKVSSESPTHLWISVQGEKELFESAFATQLEMKGNQRRQLYAASVPSRFSMIANVVGLDNTRHSRPKFVKMSKRMDSPSGIPPATIRTSYGFDPIYSAGVSGKGQDIAVATYNGFKIDDVKYFYKYAKISATIDQVAFNGTAPYDEGSAGETQLDAEFSAMIAPSANVHVFASATNDDTGETQLFTAILDDNRAKVVNYSWGGCEEQVSNTHKEEMQKIFARAVAQGVNIMVASGDSGSDSCQEGTTVADWPAANDNVVAVGGTTLTVNGGQASESGWSGSGGGISSLFDLPNWQNALGAPYMMRSYPDVSFNADPYSGQAVYMHDGGQAGWVVVGGTSMAAPQWAGFLALVGEARQAASKPALGYMNPLLYAIPAAQLPSVMNDVTSGSNGAYTAGAGWDAVTGFGSMKASALLSYFSGL